MGVTSYFSDIGVKEVVKITAISDESATCETSYKSVLKIKWKNNLPDPAPRVGESWIIEKVASATWMFVSKATSGKYNAMRYAIKLDARECIGKERAIIDDIAKSGVDEVYLRVAGDSVVMWDSTIAFEYGLQSYGDHIGQILNRLKDYGISVILVFDCELWTSDTEEHRKYQQTYLYTDEEGGTAEDVNTQHYSTKFSPLAAMWPLSLLIKEVWEKYKTYARGVCFDGFGMADEYGDFSYTNRSRYFDLYGEQPERAQVVVNEDIPVASFIKKNKWMPFIAETYIEFMATIKDAVPGCPLSVIIEDEYMKNNDTSKRLGRVATGIPDGFGKYGWNNVGMSMSFQRQTDFASELRSLEYMVAYEQRMAEGSSPLYVFDLNSMETYDAAFEIFSKYNATTILFDDYNKWRMLSDKRIIDLNYAMGKYRVTEKSELDYIGILSSSNSHSIASYSIGDNRRWSDSIEDMCSVILDKLPHKLKIFFDDDIETTDKVKEVAALVVFMADNLSDKAISTIDYLINIEDRNVVIVGKAGYYTEDNKIKRSPVPFVGEFNQSVNGTQEYHLAVHVDKGKMDIADSVFILDESDNGYVPVLDEKSTSYIQSVSGEKIVYKSAKAPVFSEKRSSMLGIDALYDSVLLDVVGDFALYALGRDA